MPMAQEINNMAQVLDDVLEDTTVTDNLTEDVEVVEVETPAIEDDLPEKYRGKTPKEIALMHQEAEKLIGKQGSEVGELRKVVDDFIKAQTPKDLKTQETETSDEDFFIEPQNAVKKAIDNHPAIKQAQEATLAYKRQEVLGKLEQEFPSFMKTIEDPSFAEWIKGSKVRTELFVRAENQFDYDSAKELLSTWNDRQQITKKATETSQVDRSQQLKAADVGTTNASEPASKKKYRRSDIIKLMQTDPDRYDAMQSEIMAAYSEGRIV
jgi:predicted RNA-binding protein YlqC (UPF0109 family)